MCLTGITCSVRWCLHKRERLNRPSNACANKTESLFWSCRDLFMTIEIQSITGGLRVKIMENMNVRDIYSLTEISWRYRSLHNTHPSSSLRQKVVLLWRSWKTGPPGLQNLSLSLWPTLRSTYHNSSRHHINRSHHPSLPLQQKMLWGHAPLLRATRWERTEPLLKGQLKSCWWWKGVHHKRKHVLPSSNEVRFEGCAVVIHDVTITYRPTAEATDMAELSAPLPPSSTPLPPFYIHRPKNPPWGFETSNTASWKSQEVSDMCSPLPSDPAASPTPKARIDFMWTWFHPCRGSPASAAARGCCCTVNN